MIEGAIKRGLRSAFAGLLVLAAVAPALANEELHPGARAFFPLWDVRTSAANPDGRVTFIVLTRLAWFNQGDPSTTFQTLERNNCTQEFNAGTGSGVIPVNIEYYNKSCEQSSEIIFMSCADVDVIVLTSTANTVLRPRAQFQSVAGDQIGAVDVHLLDGKLSQTVRNRANENSLMGNAIISDSVEGWAAVYPAAMAKSTYCPICPFIDKSGGTGTPVGYEPYPMEVFIPFVLADGTRAGGGALTNFLSLYAPALFPAGSMADFRVEGHWYDGRERPFHFDKKNHAHTRFLGTITSDGDTTAFDPRFNSSNFVCGHTTNPSVAENDGAPRGVNSLLTGDASLRCDPLRDDVPPVPPNATLVFADTVHTSDNFDTGGTTSRPIGWWDILMTDDDIPSPIPFPGLRSGRGMVGVVLSSGAGGAEGKGIGDAIRTWHKDPCEIGPEGLNFAFGPPHLRDHGVLTNPFPISDKQQLMVIFNMLSFNAQDRVCHGRVESPDDLSGVTFDQGVQ